MTNFSTHSQSKRMKTNGFTMVELAVVVAILGVLAAFGVPKFRDAVERSKASEAVAFFGNFRLAQENYHTRNGSYAADVATLDASVPLPKYFTVGKISAGVSGTLESSWNLTLSRLGASAGYGAYTVVYNEAGFDSSASTIVKLENINPLK